MVSAKQANNRRRTPNIPPNNRRFKPPIPRNGVLGAAFNGRAPPINPMFTASQIPDNPGYVDFNEPPPPRQPSPAKVNTNPIPIKNRYPRRVANNANKPMPPRNQIGGNGWGPSRAPRGQNVNQPPVPPPHAGRNFRNGPMPRLGRPMPPPPMSMRTPIPRTPLNMNPNRFGPRPMIPPPMAGLPVPPPMGPPRPPMRGGGPIPPRPIMPRGNGPSVAGPMRRGKAIVNNRKNNNNNNNNLKNRKHPLPGPSIRNKKAPIIRKTLSEIVNQYPLDKPWVTDEIRAEQKKKEDIENKLKGNKDDKLFAEFKVQRDKFVKMYEAARLEYIGKHPEQDIDKIMTESDKNKGDKAKEKANENRKTNEKPAAI